MSRNGSHWYEYPLGTPYYETPCKSRPGEMRNVTLRDAKKWAKSGERIIVPSVTTVQRGAGMSAGLVRWRIQTAIECALTLPRAHNEPLDEYARRVMDDAGRWVREAADLGTQVHAAIEEGIASETEPPDKLAPYVMPVLGWYRYNVRRRLFTEAVFASYKGYGGKCDLGCILKDGRRALVDWKTYGSKAKYTAYHEHGEQLLAYNDGLEFKADALVNVGISTRRPGELVVVEHQDHERLRRTWEAKVVIWQETNEYKPSFLAKGQFECHRSIRSF